MRVYLKCRVENDREFFFNFTISPSSWNGYQWQAVTIFLSFYMRKLLGTCQCTILIRTAHCAYFIAVKNCRHLAMFWPTLPITWSGQKSHQIQKNGTFFFYYFHFLKYVYHSRYIISTGYSIRECGKVFTFCIS